MSGKPVLGWLQAGCIGTVGREPPAVPILFST